MTSEAIDLLATVAHTYGLRGPCQAPGGVSSLRLAPLFEKSRQPARPHGGSCAGSESWALRAEVFAFGAVVSSGAACDRQ
jgi:hypothetical protein